MTDRYRGYPTAGRPSTLNPARVSLPTSLGGAYGSLYTGDADFVSSPTRYTTPRGYTTTTTVGGAPATSRTYTVNQEPRSSRPGTREPSRSRRSTVDSTARPPIIVTTLQDHHPHSSSSHSSNTHAGSPSRDPYRSGEGKLYSQPASSIRSRSTARPYHTSSLSEDYGDYGRQRDRDRGEIVLASHDADAYRSTRPSVVYPSDPRHSNAAIDYGDDGYQYTTAGELVRYDLDHGIPSRSRRHESFDRAYSRPNINYNADQRSFNVNTTHDLGRTGRPYDSRGGPPPSTRGFDKINRAYESGRDIPPAAPVPPAPTPAAQVDATGGASDRREGRRPRPVSLIQEPGSRVAQPEDFYRSHEAESHDSPRFYDDSVTARGFGIRVGATDDLDDRHSRYWEPRDDLRRDETRRDDSSRRDEPRKEKHRREGSKGEEATREPDIEQEEWYRSYRDDHWERRESRRGDDEDGDRHRIRDKLATGLGIGAAAVGLSEKKTEAGDKEHQRLRSPVAERPEDREGPDAKADAEAKERNRRDAEARLNDEAVVSASGSEDEGRRTSRRHRSSSVFDPNDPTDLRQLKEQIAALNTTSDKDKTESTERDNKRPESPSGQGSRTRDLVVVRAADEKQVRVVSPPPREKKEEKPLKGILKQPSARFPEDLNPVREGVAPHKEDKKLKQVPAGAKWTKINRKIVNPEALEIGKERFEVRDDFVIVLRVLSKEEIQAYAAATQVLRERRRNRENSEGGRDRDYDREYEEERGRRHSHRHRRHKNEADGDADDRDQDRDRDRERERRRRHKREDENEYGSRSRDLDHHHQRSHREA